jgi:hypothetical protein
MRSTDARSVSYFRTDRFFRVSGEWYFTTRENEDFGPFATHQQAENSLARYLETQSIIHYLRGADPTLTAEAETPEHLVARLSQALFKQGSADPRVLTAG